MSVVISLKSGSVDGQFDLEEGLKTRVMHFEQKLCCVGISTNSDIFLFVYNYQWKSVRIMACSTLSTDPLLYS